MHRKWFASDIGERRVVDVHEAAIDRIFGRMRRAGLSASRMHDARNLCQPAQQVMTNQELRNAAGPLGTEGTAWDIAWAVEYLASDRAKFVTGVSLPVDGGVLATSYMSMAPIISAERG